ncbi:MULTISPECIES: ABC transporter ATP-binding protein [Saccharopolyspora]|uniref:ABC transporter ATP-binding protein n=1 Tax=Saccharopolyspora elongata TaxID=2530387 RepID=A0A4R4YS64_9PSEU|nr:ABC transporter ATP-binding protein [Saccharopolyspora elongata]TDD48118.1 ABC transporter ATP-binding protein [Saccharopolyspora elongata]
MLSVQGLTAGYGRVPAIVDVTIEVAAGELVTIIGSNGAGKSTLLRALSGLIRATSGTVRFDGADITNLSPHRIVKAGLVHCPEGRHVFPMLTVRENLRIAARRGRSHERERLGEVLALFPKLGERLSQPAGSLSGGEQQMLAIGRSLMAAPKLVMLDEPSLGLAPLLVEQVLQVAGRIRDSGRTVLLVEQNAELALQVADRAYVLERGRITESGVAGELAGSRSVREAYLGG